MGLVFQVLGLPEVWEEAPIGAGYIPIDIAFGTQVVEAGLYAALLISFILVHVLWAMTGSILIVLLMGWLIYHGARIRSGSGCAPFC